VIESRTASRARAHSITLISSFALVIIVAGPVRAQSKATEDKFAQLEDQLPTPNQYRTASGAPGHAYWQQRADYVIAVEIDDVNQRLIGSETITYYNKSPDTLSYLWVQLDQNIFAPDADAVLTSRAPNMDSLSFHRARALLARETYDGGVKVTAVLDEKGQPLDHMIVKTMLRIDLPRGLEPGQSTVFSIDWNFNINDCRLVRGRTGYEKFDDGNFLYEMAQWFPRMAAYTDTTGWQNKQYLGRGEFALEFGDYLVRITVPDDHVVASSGELQNPEEVLTEAQRKRYEEAKTARKPVFVITPEEAKKNEKGKPTGKTTWIYHARNVRDFAFASSRKFIWDAQGHTVDDQFVMAMSYYPNEGEPLWSRYSTHSIIHTLDLYSRYTFTYPYPVAISVNGPVGGMEYPMICFNGPRPEKDGTYSARTKYGLISVIIHEVGHNYFPMIVNSDERRWTWMDEGLNTFLQFLSEREWEVDYPSRRGPPQLIVGYMQSNYQRPIMTHSDSILQFGPNAYAKPAAALVILRESILGPKLFDFAFREYSKRWMFKRPNPADFFRTMEDASGVDLDWFWRGWFYSTDHVDIAINDLRHYVVDTRDPDAEKPRRKKDRDAKPDDLTEARLEGTKRRADHYPELKDFYNSFDELDVTEADRKAFRDFVKKLKPEEAALLKLKRHFYVVDFENVGGLVMPITLDVHFKGGGKKTIRIPAEIWRLDSEKVSKLLMLDREVERLELDPLREFADVNHDNNHLPRKITKSRFQLFKSDERKNPMQKAKGDSKEKN